MEEAPENGKESSHSAHANGMNEWMNVDNNTHSSKYWQLDIISVQVLHCAYVLAISVKTDKNFVTSVGINKSGILWWATTVILETILK
jgi:hypothetical protein